MEWHWELQARIQSYEIDKAGLETDIQLLLEW